MQPLDLRENVHSDSRPDVKCKDLDTYITKVEKNAIY